MFVLRGDESTVHAGLGILCGTVASLAALRGFLYIISGPLNRVLWALHAPSWLEQSVCMAVLMTSTVLVGCSSALLPGLFLFITATSGSICWSRKSFRWVCAMGLLLLYLVLVHVLGPMFLEDFDTQSQEWTALVQKQSVRLPCSLGLVTHPPLTTTPVMREGVRRQETRAWSSFLYLYFDDLHVEGCSSPLALSPATALRQWPPIVGSWVDASQPTQDSGEGEHLYPVVTEHPIPPVIIPTLHILSTGDGTTLSYHSHRDGADDARPSLIADRVHLLGHRSTIRHGEVHCLLPWTVDGVVLPSSPSATFPEQVPCLRLRDSATLVNVTVRWMTEVSTPPSAPVFVSSPQDGVQEMESGQSAPVLPRSQPFQAFNTGAEALSCEEVRTGLLAQVSSAAVVASLIECVTEVKAAMLPPRFVAKAPWLVWFGWQLPGYAHDVRVAALFVWQHIAAPALLLLMKVGAAGLEAAGAVWRWCVKVLKLALPHGKRAAQHFLIFTGGAFCGSHSQPDDLSIAVDATAQSSGVLQRLSSAPSHACRIFAASHAESAYFHAGMRARTSVLILFSSAADALELVPGLWSAYGWAWRAEYRITVCTLRALQETFRYVFCVAPQPFGRALLRLVVVLKTLLPIFFAPARGVWRLLAQMHLLSYVSTLGVQLWLLEVRMSQYEWATIVFLAGLLLGWIVTALHFCLDCIAAGAGCVANLINRYNQTSFSLHMAAIVLQTALLLLGMRNEMRECVEQERCRQRNQAASKEGCIADRGLFSRYVPATAGLWMPWNALALRANAVWTLVRAHHATSTQYVLLHASGTVGLIGLSVLPFTSKLYTLSLRYIFPWMSSRSFLSFFGREQPPWRIIAVYFACRVCLVTVLQATIGDLIYHVLRDLAIAVGLTGSLVLVLWAWPHRLLLTKKVTTAIAESLQVTPMPSPLRQSQSREPKSSPGDPPSDSAAIVGTSPL